MPASASFEPDATSEMLERLGRYLHKLPPAEREAVEEFSEAVRAGRVTPSSKGGESMRQFWKPEEYDRKRRALARGREKITKWESQPQVP